MPEQQAMRVATRSGKCPFDPSPELAASINDDELNRILVGSPLLGEFEAVSVTRYEDARTVMGTESLRMGGAMPDQAGNLLSYDGAEHARLRRMLTGSFTVKRVRELRPMIEKVVTARLDALELAGPGADLVQVVCAPVPTLVICELLGVPYADREAFQRRTEIVLDFNTPRELHIEKTAEMEAYMANLVAGHREQPGDNLFGGIVRDHGDELTDAELIGIGNMLLIAGHETIASMLSASIALLLQHPEQLAIIRDDESAIENAIEELLRYVSPASILPRNAGTAICVRDQEIKAGEQIVVSILAANRDLGVTGENLDELDVRRAPKPHITFGYGPHQCLGQQLARMELRVALPALFNRFPELRLTVEPDELDYKTQALVFGVHSLPVTW